MSRRDESLFSQHEHALEKEYEVCPKCGSELSIKNSKRGPFLGCVNYPTCDYSRPIVEHERVEDRVLPGSECPKCGHELAVKQGRYGMFIGCTNYPECDHIEHEEAQEFQIDCPSCKKGHLQEKNNRYGKTFYSCTEYPKCKFVINHKPVEGECELCGFPLLMTKRMAGSERKVCADKKCGHKQSE